MREGWWGTVYVTDVLEEMVKDVSFPFAPPLYAWRVARSEGAHPTTFYQILASQPKFSCFDLSVSLAIVILGPVSSLWQYSQWTQRCGQEGPWLVNSRATHCGRLSHKAQPPFSPSWSFPGQSFIQTPKEPPCRWLGQCSESHRAVAFRLLISLN